MKTLKFSPNLVELICNGTKTTTWRLFDDKNIQQGDDITLIKRPELEPFAEAKVLSVVTKPISNINKEDKAGHVEVGTAEEMYKMYETYYKRPITPDTEIKVIKFEITRFI